MTEQQKDRQSSAGQAWDEVGRQFRSLGESLASAFKTTWESEESRQHLENIQASLEQMANDISRDISQAAQQAASSEEAHQVKAKAEKMAQSVQAAGQEAIEEIHPQLLRAFRKVREELDHLINQMEQPTQDTETATSPEETGQ